MGGPANSAFNLSGTASAIAIPYILGPVNVTGGSFSTTGNFFIGYPSLGYSTGTLTVSGGTVSENGGIFIVGRASGQGTLTLQTGGAVNVGTTKAENLAICFDAYPSESGTVNVNGGTLTVGSSSFASQIAFFDTSASGPPTGSTAVMNQTAGMVNAYGGIVFGLASGTLSGGTAALTQSGGTLYVGETASSSAQVLPPPPLTSPFPAAPWVPWGLGPQPCR